MILHTHCRSGKTLVLVALLLPVLAGMLGLVIDMGMVLATHRQAQNAADAAALAIARHRLAGHSLEAAVASARTLLRDHYSLPDDALVHHAPPQNGPFTAAADHVEVIVTHSLATCFIGVVGGSSQVEVRARAVAAIESRPVTYTLLALDPVAIPGLTISGNVRIDGKVSINSQGAGNDAAGNSIDLGLPPHALSTGPMSSLQAESVESAGGANAPGSILGLSGESILNVRRRIRSDPLLHTSTPTTTTGVVLQYPDGAGGFHASPQNVVLEVTGAESYTLPPGIYGSVRITGSGTGTVTFQPGIHVLRGGLDPALSIDTSASIVATGVLLYSTGSDHDAVSGLPDSLDSNNPISDPPPSNIGGMSIRAGSLTLSGLDDTSNPLHGLVLYQRRWSTKSITLQTATATDCVRGGIYSRNGSLQINGPGLFEVQMLTGKVSLTAPTNPTELVLRRGTLITRARQVFLVE